MKMTITDEGIYVDDVEDIGSRIGPAIPAAMTSAMTEQDRQHVSFCQCLLWGVNRIQATLATIEAQRTERALQAQQLAEAKARINMGLH
jgi:hypothetical protein